MVVRHDPIIAEQLFARRVPALLLPFLWKQKKTKPQSRSFVFFDKFVFSFFVARPVESPLRIFGFPQPAFAIVVPDFAAVHEIHPSAYEKLSRLSVCFVEPRTEYSLPSYLIADCKYSRLVPCDRKRPSSLPYPLNELT